MPKQLANRHDAFFKQSLDNLDSARAFLRDHLPRDVRDLLRPEWAEAVPGSFVDEELRQHHSDLLFRVHLKSGGDAFAYVLVEHKSCPDPVARLQLLRYVVRILVSWYEQNDRQLPLPPVVPLLVHQGPETWTVSCEFADLFGAVPDPLRPYLPSFRHALVDLAQIDDEDLSSKVGLRASLKALKYSRCADLSDRLKIVFADARELSVRELGRILIYFDKGQVRVDSVAVRNVLQELVPERTEEIMGWITQPYVEKAIAQGREQGMAQGRAQGRTEGAANALVRILEKRFGSMPTETQQRIFGADLATIEAWVERVINAPDLQSVFEPK